MRSPTPSGPGVAARMANVRQSATDIEVFVRKAATALGVRYTLNNRDLPGSPDLANRGRRWAIFVHGCFWHGHLGCKLGSLPKANREFWKAKIVANRKR